VPLSKCTHQSSPPIIDLYCSYSSNDKYSCKSGRLSNGPSLQHAPQFLTHAQLSTLRSIWSLYDDDDDDDDANSVDVNDDLYDNDGNGDVDDDIKVDLYDDDEPHDLHDDLHDDLYDNDDDDDDDDDDGLYDDKDNNDVNDDLYDVNDDLYEVNDDLFLLLIIEVTNWSTTTNITIIFIIINIITINKGILIIKISITTIINN